MNCNKRAFSFVEIIISLSIIVLLAVIGLNANNNYQDRTSNAKIVSDIETIKNALTEYTNETNSLPMPGGNNNFFKEDASYAHSYDENETFGVHGFITADTISKKYLQVTPLDPVTNQYYAYGKTKEQNNSITNYTKVANQFEIAGVFKENNTARAFVRGNFTAEVGPFNLIREYNGPNFVFDEGMYLPYNGDERILTAKIGDYTGNVTINGSTENITSKELVSGDEIVVPGGETATIYFSDGSKSILGDAGAESRLTLSQLDFVAEDNLATKVKLVLGGGTLWSKATHLDNDSGFEVFTTDSTAAVRGTIFGVNKASTSTNITVQKGKIEIAKVTNATDTDTLNEQIEENSVEKTLIPNTNGTDDESIIESDGESKGITIEGGTGDASSDTKAKDTIEEDVQDEMINEIGTISNTIIPEIESFTSDGENFEVAIALNDTYKNADFLKIEYNTDNLTTSLFNIFTQANAGETLVAYLDNTWKDSGNLILTQNTEFTHLDGSKIKLGRLKQVTIFFGTNLGDGSTLETRGQVITLDSSLSYERNEDGEIAGIVDNSAEQDTPEETETIEEEPIQDETPPTEEEDEEETIVTPLSCTIKVENYSPYDFVLADGATETLRKNFLIIGGHRLYTKVVGCSNGEATIPDSTFVVSCDPGYLQEGNNCTEEEIGCSPGQDKVGDQCYTNNLGQDHYEVVKYQTSGDLSLAGLGLGSDFAIQFSTNGVSTTADEYIYVKEGVNTILSSQIGKIRLRNNNQTIKTTQSTVAGNKYITLKITGSTWDIDDFMKGGQWYNGTPKVLDGDNLTVGNAKNITIYRKK